MKKVRKHDQNKAPVGHFQSSSCVIFFLYFLSVLSILLFFLPPPPYHCLSSSSSAVPSVILMLCSDWLNRLFIISRCALSFCRVQSSSAADGFTLRQGCVRNIFADFSTEAGQTLHEFVPIVAPIQSAQSDRFVVYREDVQCLSGLR